MVQGKLSDMTFKETCRMTRNPPLTEWGAGGSIPDGRNNRYRANEVCPGDHSWPVLDKAGDLDRRAT